MAFRIGDKVEKVVGYRFPGVILSGFRKLNGDQRYAVECTAPDVEGVIHIFAEGDLKLTDE
jgi:hypothetical protein